MAEKVIKPTKKAEKVAAKKTAEVSVKVSKKDAKVSVQSFDLTGKNIGTVSLPEELFNGKINAQLMAQAVRVYLANQRQGTASTKTRSEVTGSRRKVWRQKGTGRARHGSITGPIFVGGGIVHGPKPRSYDLRMPKKMKYQALVSALTEKVQANKIFVIDGEMSGKTKEFAQALKAIVESQNKKAPSVLFVRAKGDEKAKFASRNVERVDVVTGATVNTYGVIKNSTIVLSKQAIDEMKETFIKV